MRGALPPPRTLAGDRATGAALASILKSPIAEGQVSTVEMGKMLRPTRPNTGRRYALEQDAVLKYQIKTQNIAWGLRQEMGYPLFAPANDCTAFAGGGIADLAKGMEIAVLATQMRKDVIYLGWRTVADAAPARFAVALREMLQVDWIDGLFPHAADDTAPIVLVSSGRDEHIAVGPRGLLERRAGKPRALRVGKARAMRRIRPAASTMADRLAENNVFLPRGDAWREPPASPGETIIRFG